MLSDRAPTQPRDGSNNRSLTIAMARKLWGKGHQDVTDQQWSQLLDFVYGIAEAVYEQQFSK